MKVKDIFPKDKSGKVDESKIVSSFTANGKKYLIEKSLSVKRWKKYREIVVKLQYGTKAEELFDELKKIWELREQGKHSTPDVMLHNILHGVAGIADRTEPMLELCTLFINTSEEDRKDITDGQIAEKIEDWEAEAININDFFLLAMNFVPNLKRVFLQDMTAFKTQKVQMK